MGLRRLHTCFCCDLTTGVRCVGITYMIFNVISFLALAVVVGSEFRIRRNIENDPSLFDGEPSDAQIEMVLNFTMILLKVLMGVLAVSMLFDISILVAVRVQRPSYLLPWLIWYGTMTSLALLWGSFLLVKCAMYQEESVDLWTYVLMQLLSAGICSYLFACVFSYYLQLREEPYGIRENVLLPPGSHSGEISNRSRPVKSEGHL